MASKVVLSKAEEIELFTQLRATGSEEIRNTIICSYVGLVHFIARKFVGRCSYEYDDLVSEGYVGLIHAVDGFDVSKGNRFSTYAGNAISNSILKAIEEKGNLIHIPADQLKNYKLISQAVAAFEALYNKMPTDAELLQFNPNITSKNLHIYRCIQATKNLTSFDQPVADEDMTIEQIIPAADSCPYTELEDTLERSFILTKIDQILTSQEAFVIKAMFGFDDSKNLSVDSIASAVGVGKTKLYRIRDHALEKLQNDPDIQNYRIAS